jgi:hypothetical protein
MEAVSSALDYRLGGLERFECGVRVSAFVFDDALFSVGSRSTRFSRRGRFGMAE